MPLATVNGENDIIARIKEIAGIDVMESDYVDDSYVPDRDLNGMFVPYVLVKFNGGFDYPAENGICGPEKNTQLASVTVYVVSPDSQTTRIYRDKVREKMLTNFRPTDGGNLKPGSSYSFVDKDLGFHRYVQVLSFSYLFNLS